MPQDSPRTARVRLTIRPDEETEIPLDEVPGLRHQGLLLAVDGTPEPGREPQDKPPAKAGKTEGA
jgi:hypothetical protein